MGWLDDMPTAGWGYGAIANNATDYFLGLLYGHAATYQSPGTFDSTEQLSFEGTGRFRKFLHIKDPAPGGANNDSPKSKQEAAVLPERLGRARYNGVENDVSFCVVSNILVARMTRWQLVMEDRRASTPTIWLGRGAPQRWFRPASGDTRTTLNTKHSQQVVVLGKGFNVTSAPTTVGRVSFRVVVLDTAQKISRRGSEYKSTYMVDLSAAAPKANSVLWVVRWPGHLAAGTVKCIGCTAEAQDQSLGLVKVSSSKTSFSVTAQWSAATAKM